MSAVPYLTWMTSWASLLEARKAKPLCWRHRNFSKTVMLANPAGDMMVSRSSTSSRLGTPTARHTLLWGGPFPDARFCRTPTCLNPVLAASLIAAWQTFSKVRPLFSIHTVSGNASYGAGKWSPYRRGSRNHLWPAWLAPLWRSKALIAVFSLLLPTPSIAQFIYLSWRRTLVITRPGSRWSKHLLAPGLAQRPNAWELLLHK